MGARNETRKYGEQHSARKKMRVGIGLSRAVEIEN